MSGADNEEETQGGQCPNPYPDEMKPKPEPFSGELKGGLIIECGLITHVPEDWPLNCFPKYKAPCSRCGEDCNGSSDDGGDGGNGGGDSDDDVTGPVSCPVLPQITKVSGQPELDYTSPVFDNVSTIDLSGLPSWIEATVNQVDGGMTFTLSGTAPALDEDQEFNFNIPASNSENNCSTPLTIICEATVIVPITCPNTINGVRNEDLPANTQGGFTGGTPPYSLSSDVGGSLAFSTGVTFVDNMDGTWTLTGKPTVNGDITYTVFVSDAAGNTTECTGNTVIIDTGGAPVISCPNSMNITQGEFYDETFVVCTDPDGDILSATASGLPTGLAQSQPSNGAIRIFGTPSSAGPSTVVITCSDGTNSETCQFTLDVQAQSIVVPVSCPFSIDGGEGNTIGTNSFGQFTLGGASLTLSSPNLPAGVVLIDNGFGGWSLSGTFPPSSGSPYTYDVVATDGTQSATCSGNQIISAVAAPAVFSGLGADTSCVSFDETDLDPPRTRNECFWVMNTPLCGGVVSGGSLVSVNFINGQDVYALGFDLGGASVSSVTFSSACGADITLPINTSGGAALTGAQYQLIRNHLECANYAIEFECG